MTRFVSAADANRQFSEILGRAASGETVVITRRGAPVAQIAPFDRHADDSSGDSGWSRLLATLDEGLSLGGKPFDRDSLYER